MPTRTSPTSSSFVRKTLDQVVISSIVFVNDNHLFTPLLTFSTYTFEIVLFFDGASAADARFTFNTPAQSVLQWGAVHPEYTPATGTHPTAQVTTVVGAGTTLFAGTSASGTRNYLAGSGIVRTSSVAGNLTLQWCQDVSTATNTTVFADSYLSIIKQL